jgi:hypothetical protein
VTLFEERRAVTTNLEQAAGKIILGKITVEKSAFRRARKTS